MGKIIQSTIQGIINIFKFHKLKILLFTGLVLLFTVWLFPYSDLGDYITGQVAQRTNNMVYVQFEDLNPSFFPSPGVEMTKVTLDTPFIQGLTGDVMTFSPQISSFLKFRPGMKLSGEGIFKGDVDFDLELNSFNATKLKTANIDADLSKVELSEVSKMLRQLGTNPYDSRQGPSPLASLDLEGRADIELNDLVLDPHTMALQEGEVVADVKNLKMGSMNLQTPMGPFAVPSLEFSKMKLKAVAAGQVLKIEQLSLGEPGSNSKDEFVASAKGQLDLKPNEMGPIGAYDLRLNLEIRPSFEAKFGAIWSILESQIEAYKKAEPDGRKTYAFRISSSDLMSPPRIQSQ